MHEVVKVQMRAIGETNYFVANGAKLEAGDNVVVEADRGLDHGIVASKPHQVESLNKLEQPVRKIIRKANPWDEKQIAKNKAKSKDLVNICDKKILEHKLPMKLVDAEYSFDRSKIIFYFTSDNRVDFRELVKNLASIFRVRIELRQIGVRDEARMLGGHGPCGRELCCMTFLDHFEPVTIRMAKVQNLPLNPSKISGLCSRLMCCLGFEYENYRKCSKGMPKVGKEMKTEFGKGKVIASNPLTKTVTVDLGDGKIKDIVLDGNKKECQKDEGEKGKNGKG